LARLGVIQVSKQCPEDIKEAVATLIYAAPRIDVKELAIIREQLIIKFGKEFGMECMSNTNNIVNARIVHKLSVMTPENYLVYQYLNEIAKSHNLDWSMQYDPPPPSSSILPENYGHVCYY
jgi:vacuolar protein sorting-associated protein IST1